LQMKQNQQFETFNDGVCAVFALNNQEKYQCKFPYIRFAKRIIGSKRFFEAAQVNQMINLVIRIPFAADINTDNIVIIGEKQYKVIQVQNINTTRPNTTDLSLQQLSRLVALEA